MGYEAELPYKIRTTWRVHLQQRGSEVIEVALHWWTLVCKHKEFRWKSLSPPLINCMTVGAEVLGGSDGAARGEQVFHNGIDAGILTKDEVCQHSCQLLSHEVLDIFQWVLWLCWWDAFMCVKCINQWIEKVRLQVLPAAFHRSLIFMPYIEEDHKHSVIGAAVILPLGSDWYVQWIVSNGFMVSWLNLSFFKLCVIPTKVCELEVFLFLTAWPQVMMGTTCSGVSAGCYEDDSWLFSVLLSLLSFTAIFTCIQKAGKKIRLHSCV